MITERMKELAGNESDKEIISEAVRKIPELKNSDFRLLVTPKHGGLVAVGTGDFRFSGGSIIKGKIRGDRVSLEAWINGMYSGRPYTQDEPLERIKDLIKKGELTIIDWKGSF